MDLGPLHMTRDGKYIRKHDRPDWPSWNVAEMNTQHSQHLAYARLFMYAPELLEVVMMLCNGLQWHIENRPNTITEYDEEALAEAMELIAKVKGE